MATPAGSGFQLNYTTLDQAVANAKNLLLTNHGERVMLPTFGCNLKALVFDQLTEELAALVDTTIREAFAFWLPYININELIVVPVYDANRLDIQFVMSLKGNEFDTRSISLSLEVAE
jgi:phage baseplate assembly protein W